MTLRRVLVMLPLLVALAVAGAVTVVTSADAPAANTLAFDFDGTDRSVPIEPILLRRRTITPEFDPPLDLRAGRVVIARGPVACDPGEVYFIDLVLTQDGSEAVGRTAGRCTGEAQQWTVYAVVRGPETFTEGPAHACAVATTRRVGITDRFEWCADPVLAAV